MGARDSLAGGKSTFFVELSETSSILRRRAAAIRGLVADICCLFCRATKRSMVILDEVRALARFLPISNFESVAQLGRGTSTHDGVAIAWATLDFIIRKVHMQSHVLAIIKRSSFGFCRSSVSRCL